MIVKYLQAIVIYLELCAVALIMWLLIGVYTTPDRQPPAVYSTKVRVPAEYEVIREATKKAWRDAEEEK